MSGNGKVIDGLGAALVLAGTGWLMRQGAASGWEKVKDEPPPPAEPNPDVRLRDIVAWALLSGATVGVARALVRRKLVYRGSPLEDQRD